MSLSGKILITGVTGSLGTAILQRARDEAWDVELSGIARNETKINQTQEKFPEANLRVGDINDYDFLRLLFDRQDTIIHAAAQKIVPLAESNVRNSVITNVMGTLTVCQAAADSSVNRVVTILTDKLVKSTTVYGATKFLAGAITREANTWGSTRFTCARYGNVIGSANSILPALQARKEAGLPFQITDERCTRFWLTMDEAIDLILLAAEQEPGTTVVPKAAASPVLSLFRAVDPIWPIVDIGIRPGEKIHEQLIEEVESRCTIDKETYFLVYPPLSDIESNLPDGYGYYSNAPARELTSADLRSLLGLENE